MALAGAALSGVGTIAAPVTQYATKQISAFERDPLLWLEDKLWKWGWGLLLFGAIASAVGAILRSQAVRAANDEASFLQQEAALFGNLGQGPTVNTGLSWDIGKDAGTILGDAGSIVSWPFQEAGKALSDIGSAIWLGLKNMPRLLWDDLVYVVGMVVGNILDFVFPFMLVFGAVFVAIAMALRFVRSVIIPRVHIRARAQFQKWVGRPLDRLFKTEESIPAAVEERVQTQRVEVIGGEESTAEEAIAAQTLAAPASPEPAGTALAPPEAPPSVPTPENAPDSISPQTTPPPEEAPIPGGATTEETEDALGEVPYADAKMRMRAALKEKEAERSKTFAELVEERQAEDREEAYNEMRRALQERDSAEA